MFLFGGSFWVSVSALLFTLFGFFTRILARNKISQAKKSNSPCVPLRESNGLVSGCSEPGDKRKKEKSDADEVQDREGDMSEEESPKFCFKFEFQTETLEKFSKSFRGTAEDVALDSVPSSSQSKYEFMSENALSCFVEKPQDKSFNVGELYTDPDEENLSFSNKEDTEKGFLSETEITHQNPKEEEADLEETSENSTDNVREKGALDEPVCEEVDDVDSGDFRFLSEKDFIAFDSDIDSIASSHDFTGYFLSSISEGFLSDGDFEEGFEVDPFMDFDGEKEESIEDLIAKHEADDFEDEDTDMMEELRKLEESEANSPTKNENSQKDEINGTNNETTTTSADSKKSSSETSPDSESEGLETLWEHQDLVEQLKMELKKVRASGLPTILEESEYPKIMEDLKPWKIEEKFQHADRMSELHKFYKSYRERMRKLDILNYQKMYAIGFFQSKDPLQSFSTQGSSSHPSITSLLPQNLWLGKGKKHKFDPTVKFIRELHTDLEAVYVGQLCLSWEILHWQYEKALELWESDRYGIRRYNEVAGEFQQFQVLMQRFIENEPFEGPRVQNYVKKRCVFRNLLQVPVIREDKGMARRKGKGKGKEDDAITSDMLVEIMEESIRIFWKFARADKEANVVFQKSRKGTQVEPLDPNDLELLSEVQTSLQKKDKKLKEQLRCGNCILRKFKKHQEENSDQVLYFFSQVDLKLVARVLNMAKVTTDQLLWCRSKLSGINFVNRRLHVEPSFTIFPC